MAKFNYVKKLSVFLVVSLWLVAFNDTSYATSPPMTTVDIGNAKGQSVNCTGSIFLIHKIAGCSLSKSDDKICTLLTVEDCHGWDKMSRAECYVDHLDAPLMSLSDEMRAGMIREPKVKIEGILDRCVNIGGLTISCSVSSCNAVLSDKR